MNPEQLLHQRAIERVAASEVREPGQQRADFPEAIGIAEHLVAKLNAVFPGSDRLVALHEAREVELELMPVARRVGASNLAHLAVVAEVDDVAFLLGGELTNVAVVLVVDGIEQRRERRAQIEAQPAALADVEDARDFLVEALAAPVLRLGRVVG